MKSPYQIAVERLKQSPLIEQLDYNVDSAFGKYLLIAAFGIRESGDCEDGEPELNASDDDFWQIVKWSRTDPDVFDYCLEQSKHLILTDRPLPAALKLYSCDVLDGKRKRPTPPHREQKKVFGRYLSLYQLVVEAHHLHGLTLTRNDASAEQMSACDAVAEALDFKYHYTEIKNLCVHPAKASLRRQIVSILEFTGQGNELTLTSEVKT